MSDYDFSRIFEPSEFQDFARDMVQVRYNLCFESFAEGKDLGIDGRCVLQDSSAVILQVKRYKSIKDNILRIAREEKEKLDRLSDAGTRINRYILVLSEDISVQKKGQVQEILAPYVIKEEDIIIGRDLNDWLSLPGDAFRDVEEKYFKLWIQNTKTLRRVVYETVNSSQVYHSEVELRDAIEKAQVFVETQSYDMAIKQLRTNHVLIISGAPGMGKTTLAKQVALYYYTKYQCQCFACVSEVDELYAVESQPGRKVIVFDDFWGSGTYDIYGNGQKINKLVTFIKYLQKQKNTVLLLTTREYILEQGLKLNEDFRLMSEKYKMTLHLEHYSKADRLRIYYGHIRNTSLTWKQADALVKAGNSIIISSNYNPRVLEDYMQTITTDQEPRICVKELRHFLDCPETFWLKIWNGLSQEARCVFAIMALMPVPVEYKYLRKSYDRLIESSGHATTWKTFGKVVDELERTVIRTELYLEDTRKCLTVTFQNPSVFDFIHGFLKENLAQYKEVLLNSCDSFEQYVMFL